jgi:hypothetical protein
MCAWVSRKLMKCGERVPLIIIVDANLWQPIPPNVDKCLNLYVTNKIGIFHGSPVYPEFPSTPIVNWDVSQGQPPWYAGGVNHFDIDSTDWVHQIIIDEINATFAPHLRRPFRSGVQNRFRRRPTNVVRIRCLPNAAAPRRQYEPVSTSARALPGAAPPREPTPAVLTTRAVEKVQWQPRREPQSKESTVQQGTANSSSEPLPGLRLRF